MAHSVEEWRRHNTVLLCNLCSGYQTCYRVTIAHWLANGYNIGQNTFTTENKVRCWSANVHGGKEMRAQQTYVRTYHDSQTSKSSCQPFQSQLALHPRYTNHLPHEHTYVRMYTIKGSQTLESMHQSCTQAQQLIYIPMYCTLTHHIFYKSWTALPPSTTFLTNLYTAWR